MPKKGSSQPLTIESNMNCFCRSLKFSFTQQFTQPTLTVLKVGQIITEIHQFNSLIQRHLISP